jgi:hypothetical protein
MAAKSKPLAGSQVGLSVLWQLVQIFSSFSGSHMPAATALSWSAITFFLRYSLPGPWQDSHCTPSLMARGFFRICDFSSPWAVAWQRTHSSAWCGGTERPFSFAIRFASSLSSVSIAFAWGPFCQAES